MHPLEQKLRALRSRVRRLIVLHAVAWMVGAGLGTVIVVGLADYLLRFQDPGMRTILSMAVLAAVGWTCYRYLYCGLVMRLRDVELAIRLQRRFPELGDSLASAVEFLRQSEDDPASGSLALRRAVIARTTAETEAIDFGRALDARPALRTGLWSAAICLGAAVLVAVDPPATAIAVARLVNPLGSVSWPQATHLTLRKRIERVARGQALEIEAEVPAGEELPDDVRIHYRLTTPEGTTKEESELMRVVQETTTAGEKRNISVARRENVVRPFSYRLTGGDDTSMGWIAVEVLDPPLLESLELRLIAPDYTGLPPETSGRLVRAIVGTRVEIAARADKRLRSAALVIEGGREVPGQIGEDGYSVSIGAAGKGDESNLTNGPEGAPHKMDSSPFPAGGALVIERSGNWSLRLTDEEDLTGDGGARWEVRAVPDNPPTVTVEQPAAAVYVTPRAIVPLRVVAKDDLAVRKVEIVASRTEQPAAEPWVMALYKGPDKAKPRAAGLSSGADLSEALAPIEYRWDLAPLDLRPPMQITFHATATDYRGQTGRSEIRRVIVITPEELADRIAASQAAVLAELARILQMQRQARDHVAEQELKVAAAGRRELDVDRLRGAELNQRQVHRSLTSRTDGVPMLVLALLADWENNRVDSPDIRRRMEGILAEIDRLDRDRLPAIGRDLTAAIKAAQIALDENPAGAEAPLDPAIATSLTSAREGQDAVVRSLEEMLGQLARWDNYRRFHRDVGQLVREQTDLSHRAAELLRSLVSEGTRQLLPQQLADLRLITRQQFDLGRRLGRIEQEMAQAAAQLQESDPLAAETLSDALDRARELGIGNTVQRAAVHLQQNVVGLAVEDQNKAIVHLQEVLDILANRRESELARLVKKLREAETDLEGLAGREEAVRARFEAASKLPDAQRRAALEAAVRDQAALQQDTDRMARRLERLLAQRAARSARGAAGKMAGAGQSGQEGDAAKAAGQAADARSDLQRAQQELLDQRRQAEVELAVQQLARLEDAVRNVHKRQQNAREETLRLDTARQAQEGRLTPGQEVSLVELAREQDLLRVEVADLIEKMAGAKAFVLALDGVAADMARAAELLARSETGPPTRDAQEDALGRLAQLLEALKPEEPDPSASQGPGGQGSAGSTSPQGRSGGIQTLAELKLLKLMQESINARTRALEKDFGGVRNLSDEARVQYQALGQEQGRLATLLGEMLRAQPAPEDNPQSLPGPEPKPLPKPRTEPPGPKPVDLLEENLR